MTTALELYQESVASLPAGEQLRLASLILNRLQSVEFIAPVPETPRHPVRPRRVHGRTKNYPHYMADDFDAPLDDMRKYMK